MNYLKKSKLLKILILFILFILYICISIISYADNVSSNISESVFRLHVIANSDSSEDQALKLKVRDSLINYMNTINFETVDKSEAIELAISNIENFYNVANDVIISEGYEYPLEIHIEKSNFPTKDYGDVSLPAGIYDALTVKIGDANGHNWWCVMFPPLCFVDVSSGIVPDESKELLKDSLSEDEYEIITAKASSNETTKFKFKLIEIVEQFKSRL